MTITVDMAKAREIQRERIREMRAPLFADLDIAFMRAVEAGDIAEQKRIGDIKHALRTAPQDPAIDAAQTPEELKAAIPDVLKD